MSHTHLLTQDVPATVIPAGEIVTLPSGTEVHIAQTLGGNVTVRTDRGPFRIAREDVAAIGGYTPESGTAVATAAAAFSEQAVWGALKTCFDPEIPVHMLHLRIV